MFHFCNYNQNSNNLKIQKTILYTLYYYIGICTDRVHNDKKVIEEMAITECYLQIGEAEGQVRLISW